MHDVAVGARRSTVRATLHPIGVIAPYGVQPGVQRRRLS
jgi:hypothetical protein